MKINVGERRSGRTTKAIQMLYDNPNLLFICCIQRQRDGLRNENPDIADRIYGINDSLLGMLKDTEVILDDANFWIQETFRKQFGHKLHTIIVEKE